MKIVLQFFSFLALYAFSLQVWSGELVIDCSLLGDDGARICTFESNGISPSGQLVEIIDSVIAKAEGGDTADICFSSNPQDETAPYFCNLNAGDSLTNGQDIFFQCDIDSNLGEASCSLARTENNVVVGTTNALEMSCSSRTGKCVVSSNIDALKSELTSVSALDDNISSLSSSFLNCVSQNTHSGFKEVCDAVMADILNGNPNQAIAKLEALQPINPDAGVDKSFQQVMHSITSVSNRLNFLRQFVSFNKESVSQVERVYYQNEWHDSGVLFAQNDAVISDVSPSTDFSTSIIDDGRLSLYLNGSVVDGKYERGNEGVELASEISGSALVFGLDYRLGNDQVAGLALNYAQDKSKYEEVDLDGELNADTFIATGYYSFFTPTWYIDTTLTIGGSNFDQERTANINNADVLMTSKYHGQQVAASFASGWQFYVNQFNFTPYAEVMVGQIQTDEYKERGAAAVSINEQKRDIGTLQLGARASMVINVEHAVLIPEVNIRLINDFEDEAQNITGTWVNDATSPEFTMTTDGTDSNYMSVGLGLSCQLQKGNAGFIMFESIEGYENLDQHRVSAGWRWEL